MQISTEWHAWTLVSCALAIQNQNQTRKIRINNPSKEDKTCRKVAATFDGIPSVTWTHFFVTSLTLKPHPCQAYFLGWDILLHSSINPFPDTHLYHPPHTLLTPLPTALPSSSHILHHLSPLHNPPSATSIIHSPYITPSSSSPSTPLHSPQPLKSKL